MKRRNSTSNERWRDNWLAVSPSDGVLVQVGRSRRERRASRRSVAALPAGTPVVLTASAPGAIRRCCSFASDAGVVLEREYLALPSAAAPAYLVEDAPASVAVFLESVLIAPPGVPFVAAFELGLRIVRALKPWRLVRAAAPGRIVVGRCA
jgi:hypothetical protein